MESRNVTAMSTQTAPTRHQFGDLLRHWRSVRVKSQLSLASDARTTPRYVSFVETGRAQPSRQMVVRLARALDVPLRERNELLLAAGFAPLYSDASLTSPSLAWVDRALRALLTQHEPFPAVVMDRGWNLERANRGAEALFGRMFAPDPVPGDANVLRLIIEPGPVREHITNWTDVVPALLDRAGREAVGGVFDRATADLVAALRNRPDVRDLVRRDDSLPTAAPVVDLHFDVDGEELRFFSVVSTIGTPIDVTAQELRLEAFFPSDGETRDAWLSLTNSHQP
jgi:transcriptional regulator with XRE-family HTH domain